MKNLGKNLSIVSIIIIVIFSAFLISYRLISGRSLGIKNFAAIQVYMIKSSINAILHSSSVKLTSNGQYQNIIFLHHSTGYNLINQGNVREQFSQAGYKFWDQNYNFEGLQDPLGQPVNFVYFVPEDNTDPKGLARIFRQPVFPIPINTLSGLLQHEVIIIKSCFPNSHITSDEQLERDKGYYLEIRDTIDSHPDKLFIIMTQPPLNPAETIPEAALRAREIATWLSSDDFLAGHPNISTFDFFDLLAESDPNSPEYNMLRQDYRQGTDSHPNQFANQTIAPLFVDFVVNTIETFRSIKNQ
jgi:hypothetical protein